MIKKILNITILCLFLAAQAQAASSIDGSTLDQLQNKIVKNIRKLKADPLEKKIKGLENRLKVIEEQEAQASTEPQKLELLSKQLKIKAKLAKYFYDLCLHRRDQIKKIIPDLNKLREKTNGIVTYQQASILENPETRQEVNKVVGTIAFLAALGSKHTQANVNKLLNQYDDYLKRSQKNIAPAEDWIRGIEDMRRNLNNQYANTSLGLRTLELTRSQLQAQTIALRIAMLTKIGTRELQNMQNMLNSEDIKPVELNISSLLPDKNISEEETYSSDIDSKNLKNFSKGLPSLQ